MSPDPVDLATRLLRRASVTPADDGAQAVLMEVLSGLGFAVTPLRFGDTPNFVASIGGGAPNFCFAGHTDVVPPGPGWRHDPFAGAVEGGVLYGRGAVDMKGGVAAFVAAAAEHLRAGPPRGTLTLLITGDEEGPGHDGTVQVVEWLRARGRIPDFCLVGEPTSQHTLGDAIKIGRRGSLNAAIAVHGIQGHVAYPHLADNPVHRLLAALGALLATELDRGTEHFEPSRLQITTVDVGNPATNLIPPRASARLNLRFNDRHTGAGLVAWLHETIARHAPDYTLEAAISGEAFLTGGPMVARLQAAIARITGTPPALHTGGGTSDARFFAHLCPVAEFGLVGATMHKVDECVAVDQIRALTAIYAEIIREFL